ncbi:TIGR02281 family clan AA aspartic protease [Hirschia litorea]|uniref:TIGR02281 family clan AA aspartic protease n=1 Tax=Hirschia litorea TaxID=1199156 RepID=A0ABW2IH89_9PROT
MNSKIGPYFIVFAAAFVIATVLHKSMDTLQPKESDAQIQTAVTNVKKPMTQFDIAAPGQLAASLRKRPDGHYWAQARVDNLYQINFMVDTGASICVLTPEDARRLGYDFATMEKDIKIKTASGSTYGASITIKRLEIGRVLLKDVDAVVLDDNLEQSLLGMSFLERLTSWEVSKAAIIIHQ